MFLKGHRPRLCLRRNWAISKKRHTNHNVWYRFFFALYVLRARKNGLFKPYLIYTFQALFELF